MLRTTPAILAPSAPPPLAQLPSSEQAQTSIQNFFDPVVESLSGFLGSALVAIICLVIGVIVAAILRSVVRNLLKRTELDNRIAQWLTGQEGGESIPVENTAGQVAFWVVILFAVVAALQELDLEGVAGPLDTLLDRVVGFLPQAGAALLLLALAWLLATVVRLIVTRVLRTANVDERLGEQVGDGDGGGLSLSEAVGNALYWFVFLLFLPSILSTLQLEGTLEPVQQLLDRVLGILPNIFAALAIAAIGWAIATVVRRAVTNLLSSTGANRLGERFGIEADDDSPSLAEIIGTVAYILVLIPVAIAALEELQINAISEPAIAMLDQILAVVPKVFTAGLILALAFFGGKFVAELVESLLESLGFNDLLQWLGFSADAPTREPTPGSQIGPPPVGPPGVPETSSPTRRPQTPSEFAGTVVLVGIMLFAALAAVDVLEIEELSGLIDGIVIVSGRVLSGIIVLGIGLFFANYAFKLIQASGARQSNFLAQAARIAIATFSVALGLQQMGIATSIVNLAFGLLFGAVAVAVALAFGLGAREIAAEQVREWLNSFKSGNS